MALLKDITLTDSVEIKTTPEKIFYFLINLLMMTAIAYGTHRTM